MIGQTKLQEKIDRLLANGFPRFTILYGMKGSGKKLMANYIAKQLGAQVVHCGIKADEVRDIIRLAYKQSEPTVYIIADADNMSVAAKNSLLKITEEPPRKAYFIMTITDPVNTLETLRSRGCVLGMDAYIPSQIVSYAHQKGYDVDCEIASNICITPGQVDLLVSYNVTEFNNFVNNVAVVNGANAFKLVQRLKCKDEDNGYDLTLFLQALMIAYRNKMTTNRQKYIVDSIAVISKYLSQLRINGINKAATMDMMILELRGVAQEVE